LRTLLATGTEEDICDDRACWERLLTWEFRTSSYLLQNPPLGHTSHRRSLTHMKECGAHSPGGVGKASSMKTWGHRAPTTNQHEASRKM
jgi:hypothetical protein